jgi:hypothetical protein
MASRSVVGQTLSVVPSMSRSIPGGRDVWRDAFDALERFAPLELATFNHVDELSPGRVVALVASWSSIAALPDRDRGDVLAAVRAIVSDEPRLALA